MEYGIGNSTGAEQLAAYEYLENFEHVESLLEEKGTEELKEEIEDRCEDFGNSKEIRV